MDYVKKVHRFLYPPPALSVRGEASWLQRCGRQDRFTASFTFPVKARIMDENKNWPSANKFSRINTSGTAGLSAAHNCKEQHQQGLLPRCQSAGYAGIAGLRPQNHRSLAKAFCFSPAASASSLSLRQIFDLLKHIHLYGFPMTT